MRKTNLVKTQKIDYKNALYPPGGILIWIILTVEILTFLLAIFSFMYTRSSNIEIFNSSQANLNATLGTINTLILITSGFFMAKTVSAVKKDENKKANQFIVISIVLGFMFLVIKSFEYYHKIELGLTIRTNTFYTYYWFLTGFHFLHVLIGVILLLAIKPAIKKAKYNSKEFLDVETVATFWHMCDIIWILIFPVIYLMK